jgi:hypothetical protein
MQIDMLWPMVKDFVPAEHGLFAQKRFCFGRRLSCA